MSGIVRFSPGVRRNMFRTYVFRGMDGTPRVFRGSPERERRAFSVHHATGRAVQEDEHLLPLVLVLHEPHGGVGSSPSYGVGETWIGSKVATRFFPSFPPNLWATDVAWP